MAMGIHIIDSIKKQKAIRKAHLAAKKASRDEMSALAKTSTDMTYNEDFAREISSSERAAISASIAKYKRSRKVALVVVALLIVVLTSWGVSLLN